MTDEQLAQIIRHVADMIDNAVVTYPSGHVDFPRIAYDSSALQEYFKTELAAPDIHRIVTEQAAEIQRLRAALDRAAFVLSVMPDIARRVGLAGTSQWDEIAGGPDLFGALDQSRTALAVKP